MTTERLLWADGIRIFAIYSVIFIHSSGFLPQRSSLTIWEWLLPLCGFIGVPLFVMLSGALLLGKRESNRVFFQKRCMHILLPWFFWTLIYVLADHFLYGKQLDTLNEWIRYFYVQFFSRFWFLPMIFGVYLTVPILKPLLGAIKQREIWYVLGLWFFAFSLLPAMQQLVGIHIALDSSLLRQTLQHSGLFILGYLLTKDRTYHKSIRFWFLLLLAGITGTAFFVVITSFFGNSGYAFFFTLFSPNMLAITISIFMLLYLSLLSRQKTVNPMTRNLLAEMSIATLGIYLSHELITNFFLSPFLLNEFLSALFPFFAVAIRALIVFLCSFVFIAIVRRIPFLKYIT